MIIIITIKLLVFQGIKLLLLPMFSVVNIIIELFVSSTTAFAGQAALSARHCFKVFYFTSYNYITKNFASNTKVILKLK